MRIAIGLLLSSGFPVPAPFVLGLTDLLAHVISGKGNLGLPSHQQITEARIISSQGFPIDTARNDVCRIFLDDSDLDALLFLDADMRHPADLPHRLVRHGVDVVTARYHLRKPPFHVVAMRKTGAGTHQYDAINKVVDHMTGLIPVDACGAGALLVQRRVLQAIRTQAGDDWFRYQTGPSGLRTVSEDMWFCEQARACGFPIYLDADTECTHVASFEVTSEWGRPFMDAYRAKQAQVVAV